MTPTWTSDCGRVQLYLGDCREILPTLWKVDAVVTDPPYGIRADDRAKNLSRSNATAARDYGEGGWDNSTVSNALMAEIIAKGKFAAVWGGNYYQLDPSPSWLVWDKLNTGDFADGEMAWCNAGFSLRIKRHLWNGMIRKGGEERFHPTQKPLEVMEWCLSFSPKFAVVLDPFMGSGTTGVACIRTGRRFIGIEIEPRYFEIAKERIQRELAQPFLIQPEQPKMMQEEMV
jgi:site-specific DNA-methyltransferase (adenine-specific)/modification methylase